MVTKQTMLIGLADNPDGSALGACGENVISRTEYDRTDTAVMVFEPLVYWAVFNIIYDDLSIWTSTRQIFIRPAEVKRSYWFLQGM